VSHGPDGYAGLNSCVASSVGGRAIHGGLGRAWPPKESFLRADRPHSTGGGPPFDGWVKFVCRLVKHRIFVEAVFWSSRHAQGIYFCDDPVPTGCTPHSPFRNVIALGSQFYTGWFFPRPK
jgi:hypothetical protein